MWRCRDIPQRSGRTFFRMARTNDNRYEQSPTPFASLETSDHPARGIGAAARIRTVNPLLTKQPRFRCATAARFRQPRYPDRMAPVGCTDGGRSRRSAAFSVRNYRYRSEQDAVGLGSRIRGLRGAQRSFQKRSTQHFTAKADCHHLAGRSLPSRQTPWNLPQSAAPCAMDGLETIRQI